MSSASQPPLRRPLHQRTESQNNRLAIRIVPYSPPRPVGLQIDPPLIGNNYNHDGHDSQKSPVGIHRDAANRLPSTSSTLGSSATSTVRLVPAMDIRVSGSKLAAGLEPYSAPRRSSMSTSTALGTPTTPTIPAPDTSHTPSPAPTDFSHISRVHASSRRADNQTAARPTSSSRAPSRRRHRITIHPDSKTFSLEPQSDSLPPSVSLSLSLSASSSFERLSSAFSGEGRPSSPMTTLPDRSFSPCTPASSTVQLPEDPITDSASSWNYRLVGGLRKVPKTPDLAQIQPPRPPSSEVQLPTLLENTVATEREQDLHSLLNKSSELSFESSQSASTDSETTNYKVYNVRQPAAPEAHPDTESLIPPSSSDSNYQVLGRSSPCAPSTSNPSPPKTASSDINYVLHGDPSSSSPLALRSAYSQESLIVPPLRPGRKNSSERFGLYKARSRDSLAAGSLTSINSVVAQEAIQTFFAIPIALQRPRRGTPGLPSRYSDSWATNVEATAPSTSHMASHPHIWSSQLSTVISESESGSEPVSRSVSALSGPARRNSGFQSNHSRQMLSISSSLAAHDEHTSRSQSLTDSLERPQPSYHRGGTVRLVRDQDEHGDGLADLHDLQELHQRPSRRRLSSFISSTSSSDRNIHSSGSSRANSLTNTSLPTWARLYYGSGERRWLRHGVSSESMLTDYNDGSRSLSSFRSGSPSIDNLSMNLRSPRRRPREVQPSGRARRPSDAGSMEIEPAPATGFHLRSNLRKQTSSVWSPHLGRDQRASGYSIWEPPSVSWSLESSPFGRRNVQVVMFIMGFIVPFAWMVAAFLPLPPRPYSEMGEREQVNSSMLDIETELPRNVTHIDEIHYRSATWWRNLNRIMALVGVLIVAAIITLAVVGVKQGWGHSSS